MRKVFALILLGFVLTGAFGAGLVGLQEAFAEGESPILPLLLLTVPALAAGVVVALILGRLVRPLRTGSAAPTVKGLVALAVAAVIVGGAYVGSADVPLQRPDAVVTAAVAPACNREASSAAGAINTDGSALNHVVVLDRQGAEFGWTGKPSVAWRPGSVGDVEIVVCVDREDTTSVIEVCKYNGPDVTRYAATRELSIVAARTGVVLAHATVTSNASSCPGVLARDVTELTAEVGWSEVEAYLTGLVERGRYEPPADGDGSQPSVEPGGEPGESIGPDASSEPIDLAKATLLAALKDGRVTVDAATADNLQWLDLTVTSKVEESLELTIPAGTILVPVAASVQTMVVISPETIQLDPLDTTTVTLDVACSQMHDAQPGEGGKANRFHVQSTPASGALAKLLKSTAFAAADFRLQQFAIWTITDNPTRSGYVGLGTFGVGSGPSAAEIREIKSMFRSAGIDTSHYRALR